MDEMQGAKPGERVWGFHALSRPSNLSCHHFLISSVSVRSLPFLSYIVLIIAWSIPLVALILLKRSLVFPFCCFPLFLCIVHLRRWTLFTYLSLLFSGSLHSVGTWNDAWKMHHAWMMQERLFVLKLGPLLIKSVPCAIRTSLNI